MQFTTNRAHTLAAPSARPARHTSHITHVLCAHVRTKTALKLQCTHEHTTFRFVLRRPEWFFNSVFCLVGRLDDLKSVRVSEWLCIPERDTLWAPNKQTHQPTLTHIQTHTHTHTILHALFRQDAHTPYQARSVINRCPCAHDRPSTRDTLCA